MFKIKSRYIIIPAIVMLVAVGTVWAQPKGMHSEGMGKHCMSGQEYKQHMPMIPDMTEEQKEQIEESRTEHLKVILPLKNQLMEKEARLHTLSTSEKVNMKEINDIIEDIGAIKTKMMKERAAHRQLLLQIAPGLDSHWPVPGRPA